MKNKDPETTLQKFIRTELDAEGTLVKKLYAIIDEEIKDDYNCISEKREKLKAATRISLHFFKLD